MTTVTTVGPAALDVFLTPETQATVTSIAGDDAYRGFINEFHGSAAARDTKNPAGAGSFAPASRTPPRAKTGSGAIRYASTTLTNCRFLGPFFSNFTCPSFFANSV